MRTHREREFVPGWPCGRRARAGSPQGARARHPAGTEGGGWASIPGVCDKVCKVCNLAPIANACLVQDAMLPWRCAKTVVLFAPPVADRVRKKVHSSARYAQPPERFEHDPNAR